ncbi:hypothetical protein Sjap_024605 [Stephania japonica]|uniref:Uncharacterized protein n=1 Tax=Stephania japonica TaxID=461633 RepID=A0AAP0EJ20_9MAGN
MGSRGVIGDKWSMRILWFCALGSAVGIARILLLVNIYSCLYMVAVDRQTKNREKMLAESLNAYPGSDGQSSGEDV